MQPTGAPPLLPQRGTISSFSYLDGIGRIQLEDGTELKVGTGAPKSIVSFAAATVFNRANETSFCARFLTVGSRARGASFSPPDVGPATSTDRSALC